MSDESSQMGYTFLSVYTYDCDVLKYTLTLPDIAVGAFYKYNIIYLNRYGI